MNEQVSHEQPRDAETVKAEIERLQFDILGIKRQIEHANLLRIETGKLEDINWYRRAKFALRTKQLQYQKLTEESRLLRKPKKALNFEQSYIDAAREILPKVLHLQILARAFEIEAAEKEAA